MFVAALPAVALPVGGAAALLETAAVVHIAPASGDRVMLVLAVDPTDSIGEMGFDPVAAKPVLSVSAPATRVAVVAASDHPAVVARLHAAALVAVYFR